VLYSDQGKEFSNSIIRHINAVFQVKHIRTTAGNPRSNGLVERHNLILKDQLAAFTNARQDDWDVFLSVVQFAYMTNVSPRTGYSPFFLLYGREARQPSDTWIAAFEKIPNLQLYVKRLVEVLQRGWKMIFEDKPKKTEEMNKKPIMRREFNEYRVGDRFYLLRKPATHFIHYDDEKRKQSKICPKLQRRKTGPYTITRRFSPVLYEALIDGKLQVVHVLKMELDPTNAYYRLHLPERCATEPISRRNVQFHPHWNSNGTPVVPVLGQRSPQPPEVKDMDEHPEEHGEEQEELDIADDVEVDDDN